jgi:DNA-directed RNA polymerase subunit H (RpoH/RPB5)
MTDIQKIISLYNSRKTIIKLLSSLDYNVDDYKDFSINEIDAMSNNSQLDMLLCKKMIGVEKEKKVYVKYYNIVGHKQITKNVIDSTIDDLFRIEEILTNDDTLIIIMDDEPNDSNIARMNYLYDHDGKFVVMHNIKRLQYDITEHSLVPKMTILTNEETALLMKEKNLTTLSQLPEISRFDPHALALCVRPKQVCKIERSSATALKCIYYRVCV